MMWFTERAYHYDPEVEPEKYRLLENQVIRERSFYGTPNRFFDAEHGAKLINQYLDEKVYTDEELLNFDGVMLNEHHGTPFCLGAVMDVEAAVLAGKTKRIKIVLLGNPVATVGNPLRLAEELAMIDLISGGRLVPGWVRGAGSEQFANNTNPALNRELFEEGVDFIINAWTTPGPFRHEGKRLHFRHVNPWVLPLQKPHPPFWIPGLISPDTAYWCAKRRYPYVALATKLEPTLELWHFYAEAAAREGYQAGPENFGYLQPVMIGDNQERAEELGKRLLFGGAFAHFARPEWMFPPGYNSKAATRRLAQLETGPNTSGKPMFTTTGEETEEQIEAVKNRIYSGYPKVLKDMQMIAGTPDNVIPKLCKILEVLRPGIFSFWLDGPVSAKDRKRCLELINRDVIPAMREYGKNLGLVSPFERKPGSRPLGPDGVYAAVSNPEALAEEY
ncbi:MAG TPA: LLM class flavin-dependent oxidoreductase [Candidatus Binataceae bacterium]|nr:LLM class flavin-dependent oxidoreductase [Candidatus Binataceae bacterium]